MRLINLVTAAALAVASHASTAAAQKSAGQANLERERAITSRDVLARMDDSLRGKIADAQLQLARFERNGSLACASQDARFVRWLAEFAADSSPAIHSEGLVIQAGGHWLDVADVMRKRGCADEAREMYEAVFRRYPEMAYGGLRDRARVSLQDMR